MYTTRPSRVKRVMREGKIALGTYAQMSDPAQVEIAGLCGWDAASLHWEHTSIDFHILEDLIRAADVTDIDLIVRVPYLDFQLIKRCLDLGAHGIWLPHDGSGLEGVKRALDAMRFKPKGERTSTLRNRATGYGTVKWEDHVRRAEEEIVLVATAEDPKSIAEVEQIAALDGVDLIHTAIMDIGEYLGVPWDDPKVKEFTEDMAYRVKAIGKAKMMMQYGHTHLKRSPTYLKEMGVGYAHVVPPAPTILAEHFRAKSREIREGLGYL